MREYDSIIFDLDGTLIDSLADLAASVNYMMTQLGLKERTIEEVRGFVGDGVKKLVERCLDGYDASLYEKALVVFQEYYAKNNARFTKVYDGIYETLDMLKEKGYQLAVVSNKFQLAVDLIAEEYFRGYFDIAIGESASIPRKPAPDMIMKVMESCNYVKERTLLIGDSDVDIKTAQNAGIRCLSATWGFRSEAFLVEHGAETLIHKPYDILFIL